MARGWVVITCQRNSEQNMSSKGTEAGVPARAKCACTCTCTLPIRCTRVSHEKTQGSKEGLLSWGVNIIAPPPWSPRPESLPVLRDRRSRRTPPNSNSIPIPAVKGICRPCTRGGTAKPAWENKKRRGSITASDHDIYPNVLHLPTPSDRTKKLRGRRARELRGSQPKGS